MNNFQPLPISSKNPTPPINIIARPVGLTGPAGQPTFYMSTLTARCDAANTINYSNISAFAILNRSNTMLIQQASASATYLVTARIKYVLSTTMTVSPITFTMIKHLGTIPVTVTGTSMINMGTGSNVIGVQDLVPSTMNYLAVDNTSGTMSNIKYISITMSFIDTYPYIGNIFYLPVAYATGAWPSYQLFGGAFTMSVLQLTS
jgi:hypothetical protein